MFRKISYFIYTIKYLKLIQITYRLKSYLFKKKNLSHQDLPSFDLTLKKEAWTLPIPKKQSLFDDLNFKFLNKTNNLDIIGWNNPDQAYLWNYNLHYFDDLSAHNATERLDKHQLLLMHWIEHNAPGDGLGWESYPTSLRIVNIIKWYLSGQQINDSIQESLAMQCRSVYQNLEFHLLGNHLIANAKALIFGGIIFSGQESISWLKKGSEILVEQLKEQIREDGAHFELSPMYHSIILEDFLDILNIINISNTKSSYIETSRILLSDEISKMVFWLDQMTHPDGEISFFNDSSFGIASNINDIRDYTKRLNVDCSEDGFALSSGYYVASNEKAYLIFDAAIIGPDYMPGHAHADTLSFELSLYKNRFIVNSGTSLYGTGEERLRQRSTEAHNTVVIDKENSSQVWSGFRVARRAYPYDCNYSQNNNHVLQARHDGYNFLSGKPQHFRQLILQDYSLEILDRIEGPFKQARAFFHLHPEVKILSNYKEDEITVLHSGEEVKFKSKNAEILVKDSSWHPNFGEAIPNKCLFVDIIDNETAFEITWN